MDLLIHSAFIRAGKQRERKREREGGGCIYQVGQHQIPGGFARDQAGVCCDSPWVATISCFIHNVAFTQLINARLPINDSHKTPSGLRLAPSCGPDGNSKLPQINKQQRTSCQTPSQPAGSAQANTPAKRQPSDVQIVPYVQGRDLITPPTDADL